MKGAPVVFLHGFTGSGLDFEGLLPTLEDSRRFIAPDLLGHGGSDSPEALNAYKMDACIHQLEQLIAALDVAPLHLVGYSMGGRIALSLASARPQLLRSLTLIGASPGLQSQAERDARSASDDQLASAILQDGASAFMRRWRQVPILQTQRRIPQPYLDRMDARREENNALGLASSLRGLGTGQMPPLWDALDALEVPTLLVTGQEDDKFTRIAAQMAARQRHATRVQIMDAGHTCHLERPTRLAPTLEAFWRIHDTRTP